MKKSLLVACLSLFIIGSKAQTEVTLSSFTFDDGVHTTFAVNFENVDAKDAAAFWKKQLKDISEGLSTKKQLTATGVRLPSVHNDTIAILGIADQRKKSTTTTMHLALRVNNQFIGTGEGEVEMNRIKAAKEFIYARSVQFKKEIVQRELDDATKALERLEKSYEGLVKEKERAERSMEKNIDKGKEAKKNKAKAAAELDALKVQIETKQAEVASDPSETNTAALNEMLGEREKAISVRDKADKTIVNADKKVKDLEHMIKKNIEDQGNTKAQIKTQTAVVKQITEKLANVN